jgi:hypothetical protein
LRLPAERTTLRFPAARAQGDYVLTADFEPADEPDFVSEARGPHFLAVGRIPRTSFSTT